MFGMMPLELFKVRKQSPHVKKFHPQGDGENVALTI
jgi:hypothetical protein